MGRAEIDDGGFWLFDRQTQNQLRRIKGFSPTENEVRRAHVGASQTLPKPKLNSDVAVFLCDGMNEWKCGVLLK